MKILYIINCFNAVQPVHRKAGYVNHGGMVYAKVWHNFVTRHGHKVPGDFLFMDGSNDPEYFRAALPGVNVSTFDISGCLPCDEDATYHSCIRGEGYDYVVRIDQDAFPSVDSFQRIYEHLVEHPDIDIVSAGNQKQAVTYVTPTSRIIKEDWEPWGYPTLGNCIVYIKYKYFERVLKQYRDYFANSVVKISPRPFINKTLKLGEIYSLLGKLCPPEQVDYKVQIDGQIGTDFWTMMCKEGMKQLDIVNYDGRSWHAKDHLQGFHCAMKFDSFAEVIDGRDITNPLQEKVIAPFFHTGASIAAAYFFDSFTYPGATPCRWENYFGDDFFNPKNNSFGIRAAQLSIIRMLCHASNDSQLHSQLENNIAKILSTLKIDPIQFEAFYETIRKFYSDAMPEYL